MVAQEPEVFTRDGVVYANSIDVAQKFERKHRNVTSRIDAIIRETRAIGDPLNFKQISYRDSYGCSQRAFEMYREAFSVLVMGFTGEKAMRWKIRYTRAFKMMEDELARQWSEPAPMPIAAPATAMEIDFADNQQLSDLASRLANFALQMKERAEAAETKIEEDAPKVAFAEDFADQSGTFNMRTCGKMLNVKEKDFFAHLRRRYMYDDVSGNLVPRAEYMDRGWFVVVPVSTRSRSSHFQTRVTPRGFQRLCRDFGRVDDLAAMLPGAGDYRPRISLLS